MPIAFGAPESLTRFRMPVQCIPTSFQVYNADVVLAYDQRGFETCTAAAALALLALLYSNESMPLPSLAYTYLSGAHLVAEHEAVLIENQTRGGLPLGASVEAICLFGSLDKTLVPHPDDPAMLALWLKENGSNLLHLSAKAQMLHGGVRALRLFPSTENVKAALLSNKAVAFAFRIGQIVNEWLQSPELQRMSGYRMPPPADVGARLATHACVITGFDDDRDAFRVRNSFGEKWGQEGDFWISYSTMFRDTFSSSEFYVLGQGL
jgi:hypothetical protein